MSRYRFPRALSDAVAVFVHIFTTPRLLVAIVFTIGVAYVLLCRPEMEMRAREPDKWRLMYGDSSLSPHARCLLYCGGAAMSGVIPLFIALYVKQWWQRARAERGTARAGARRRVHGA